MDIFLHVLLISVCGDSLNSCFMYKCFFSHVLPLHKQTFSFRQEKPARHNKTRACPSRLCQQQTEGEFKKIAVRCVPVHSSHSLRGNWSWKDKTLPSPPTPRLHPVDGLSRRQIITNTLILLSVWQFRISNTKTLFLIYQKSSQWGLRVVTHEEKEAN